jgi:hypothetical protein
MTKVTLFSLQAAGFADCARYANGRFWRITDLGRSALTQTDGEGKPK